MLHFGGSNSSNFISQSFLNIFLSLQYFLLDLNLVSLTFRRIADQYSLVHIKPRISLLLVLFMQITGWVPSLYEDLLKAYHQFVGVRWEAHVIFKLDLLRYFFFYGGLQLFIIHTCPFSDLFINIHIFLRWFGLYLWVFWFWIALMKSYWAFRVLFYGGFPCIWHSSHTKSPFGFLFLDWICLWRTDGKLRD